MYEFYIFYNMAVNVRSVVREEFSTIYVLEDGSEITVDNKNVDRGIIVKWKYKIGDWAVFYNSTEEIYVVDKLASVTKSAKRFKTVNGDQWSFMGPLEYLDKLK